MKHEQRFRWKDGRLLPLNGEPVTAAAMHELQMAAAGLPYVPGEDENPDDYLTDEGIPMSCAQVAARQWAQSAKTDPDAWKDMQDRIGGKPKQHVESLVVTATLEDFCRRVRDTEQGYEPPKLPDYILEAEVALVPKKQEAQVLSLKIPEMKVTVEANYEPDHSDDEEDMSWL